ncbi:hypothetical protein BCF33_1276 [Hasllibacter halocynthiae]|uniref:CopG family transcriptional regulator n=1 Tax=Hasllibacter halocynthiae TaxID=595589 RepID=A0A2T0X9V7_9RHOB|nr:DUF411 domain-containing protein [Hasllibacter halocynthiae]PRY95654.1 hypothetical protein BCF33_1276 [Hasllibacter halocynthiae]
MNTRIAALAALFLAAPALAEAPAMTVMPSPGCGCCHAWADLARAEGYDVSIRETDVAALKDDLGITPGHRSCHTALVGGYVLEGHVPFDAVARLLAAQPAIAGLAVPGMPSGSPGMGDDPDARYDVIAFGGTAGAGEVFHEAGR